MGSIGIREGAATYTTTINRTEFNPDPSPLTGQGGQGGQGGGAESTTGTAGVTDVNGTTETTNTTEAVNPTEGARNANEIVDGGRNNSLIERGGVTFNNRDSQFDSGAGDGNLTNLNRGLITDRLGATSHTSLSSLSTSLLNMGLPAFAALPTFIPSFEPKRDSEPPYRPQVQPQPPQPQPRPEPQPAIQAQQAATQAAAPKPPRGPKRRLPAHKRPACASSKRTLLRGKRPRPKQPRKPPFRPSASRPPPWQPSPARWPRTSSRRPAWALC